MLHRKLVRSLAVKSVLLLGMLALPGLAPAWAQKGFPDRTVTLVVPSQPGGSIDFLARLLSEPLSKSMGVPVVVENKPGASGNIGNMQVARARPDGYTLLLAYNGFLVGNPHLYKTGTVDPVKELAPVSMVAQAPQIIVATNGLPANDIQTLIQYARQHPGKLNYASSGYGSVPHLAGELLRQRMGVDIAHIPYKGAGGAVVDLIAGQVDLYITSPAGVMQQIESGQIKALAVTGKERLAALPNVPTAAEAGLQDYEMGSWFAVYAPAGTAPAVVDRLNAEIRQALENPQIRQRALAGGMALEYSTPPQLAAFTAQQVDYWRDIVHTAGLKAQ